MSKVNLGTLPSTQKTFSVLLDSVCAVTALITNCDKSQIATMVSQFVIVAICDGSKHNFSDRFHSNRGYTLKCIKHVHIKIGPFQEGFLGTSIMGFITDIHTHKQIYQWNNTKLGKKTTFHIHVKNVGTLPSTLNTFSVLLDSVCAVTALITNCDKSQISTIVSQFVTVAICDDSKHNFSDRFYSNRGYTPKCIKHVHIKIGPFQEGFLGTSIMGFIIDIHIHKQIYQWNNTKMGKNTTFHIHVKSEPGYSPKYPKMFSVLLDSVCDVTALFTNCDKSQIATIVSQFVTVAICDGSKHNFSDRFLSNRGYTPKCIKYVHIKIGPFQEGSLGTSIMGFITDIHTHKQIYQWNNTKMGKNTTFHIHVKSEPGYSPKYPEHVFRVIGLSLCSHGLDNKLRQITNCDDSVAICDCRNLWRFKT